MPEHATSNFGTDLFELWQMLESLITLLLPFFATLGLMLKSL